MAGDYRAKTGGPILRRFSRNWKWGPCKNHAVRFTPRGSCKNHAGRFTHFSSSLQPPIIYIYGNRLILQGCQPRGFPPKGTLGNLGKLGTVNRADTGFVPRMPTPPLGTLGKTPAIPRVCGFQTPRLPNGCLGEREAYHGGFPDSSMEIQDGNSHSQGLINPLRTD
jgi:hypothetical protein